MYGDYCHMHVPVIRSYAFQASHFQHRPMHVFMHHQHGNTAVLLYPSACTAGTSPTRSQSVPGAAPPVPHPPGLSPHTPVTHPALTAAGDHQDLAGPRMDHCPSTPQGSIQSSSRLQLVLGVLLVLLPVVLVLGVLQGQQCQQIRSQKVLALVQWRVVVLVQQPVVVLGPALQLVQVLVLQAALYPHLPVVGRM